MPGPGDKKAAYKNRLPGSGQIGQNRRAWVRAHQNEVVLYVTAPDPERPPREAGNDVKVIMSRGPKESFQLNLSNLTSEELIAVKRVFDLAFANALPVCENRDNIAADALDDGDTSYARVFRDPPTVWLREGEKFTPEKLERSWLAEDGSEYERDMLTERPQREMSRRYEDG